MLEDTLIEECLQKLKKKKAPGEDQLKNECWIHGDKKTINKLKELLQDVWTGKGFPLRWTKGVIHPLYKKGDKLETKNYRGI